MIVIPKQILILVKHCFSDIFQIIFYVQLSYVALHANLFSELRNTRSTTLRIIKSIPPTTRIHRVGLCSFWPEATACCYVPSVLSSQQQQNQKIQLKQDVKLTSFSSRSYYAEQIHIIKRATAKVLLSEISTQVQQL